MKLTVLQIKTLAKSLDGKGKVKLRRVYRDGHRESARGLIAVDVARKRIVIDHWGNIMPPSNNYKTRSGR